MHNSNDIDVFKCLDYVRDTAKKYAAAKANREYLEQYRKTLKAKLMTEMIGEPVNAQERYAYAHKGYAEFLEGLKVAIEQEENLKWLLEAARMKVQVWQTLSANERVEKKVI